MEAHARALPAALAALLLMLPAPGAEPRPASAGRPPSPAVRPASEQAIAPPTGAVAAREPGRPA